MKTVVEMMGHIAQRGRLFKTVQPLLHAGVVGRLAAQGGEVSTFGLDHQAQLQAVHHMAHVGGKTGGRLGSLQRRTANAHIDARAANRLDQTVLPEAAQGLSHHRA